MFEGDVCVGADARVGSIASGDYLNGCSVSSTVVQGSVDDGHLLDSHNGSWVSTSDVAGGFGVFMDVDNPVSIRPSNSITINGPHSFHRTVTNTFDEFTMPLDVAGRGKRKIDDVPVPLHNGDVGGKAGTSSISIVNAGIEESTVSRQ